MINNIEQKALVELPHAMSIVKQNWNLKMKDSGGGCCGRSDVFMSQYDLPEKQEPL